MHIQEEHVLTIQLVNPNEDGIDEVALFKKVIAGSIKEQKKIGFKKGEFSKEEVDYLEKLAESFGIESESR